MTTQSISNSCWQRIRAYRALCGAIISLFMTSTHAVVFTVTNLNDSGVGSLRQAILQANSTVGDDTIAFSPMLSGDLITSGGFTISESLTLNGLGKKISIKGNNALCIFTIGRSVVANFSDLTIQDGKNGAIFNEGTLALTNSTLTGNSSLSGGAIDNRGNLEIQNSHFSRDVRLLSDQALKLEV